MCESYVSGGTFEGLLSGYFGAKGMFTPFATPQKTVPKNVLSYACGWAEPTALVLVSVSTHRLRFLTG